MASPVCAAAACVDEHARPIGCPGWHIEPGRGRIQALTISTRCSRHIRHPGHLRVHARGVIVRPAFSLTGRTAEVVFEVLTHSATGDRIQEAGHRLEMLLSQGGKLEQ